MKNVFEFLPVVESFQIYGYDEETGNEYVISEPSIPWRNMYINMNEVGLFGPSDIPKYTKVEMKWGTSYIINIDNATFKELAIKYYDFKK